MTASEPISDYLSEMGKLVWPDVAASPTKTFIEHNNGLITLVAWVSLRGTLLGALAWFTLYFLHLLDKNPFEKAIFIGLFVTAFLVVLAVDYWKFKANTRKPLMIFSEGILIKKIFVKWVDVKKISIILDLRNRLPDTIQINEIGLKIETNQGTSESVYTTTSCTKIFFSHLRSFLPKEKVPSI